MNGREWYQQFRLHEDDLALMYADLGEHPPLPPNECFGCCDEPAYHPEVSDGSDPRP